MLQEPISVIEVLCLVLWGMQPSSSRCYQLPSPRNTVLVKYRYLLLWRHCIPTNTACEGYMGAMFSDVVVDVPEW